jgi:hypothetical protein
VSEVTAQIIIELFFDTNTYQNRKFDSFTHHHVLHRGEEDERTHLTERTDVFWVYLQHSRAKREPEEPRRDRWKLEQGRQLYFEI